MARKPSTEVAPTTSGGGVPALVQPSLDLTPEDVALPRIKVAQFSSAAVQDEIVSPGAIFASAGSEDPDPVVLYEPGSEEGVTFYVLGLKKGKSITVDNELVVFDYGDPEAPPDAWVTYTYFVAIPEVDEVLPFKWLFTKSAKPAAQQINLLLKKNEATGPSYGIAFSATTQKRENDKGKWFVPRVRQVEANPEHVKLAEDLAVMIAGQSLDAAPSSSAPAI